LSGLTRAGGERVISVSRVGEEQQKILASTQEYCTSNTFLIFSLALKDNKN